jgi:SOS-response transcriptional repressor LexA
MQVVATGSSKTQAWAERIRELRERQGWSRHTLAVKAGVTTSTIWRMEKGEIESRSVSKTKILQVFGFSDEATFLAAHHWGSVISTNVEGRLEDLRSSEATLLPIYRWGACGDPLNVESAPDPEALEYAPIGKELLVGRRGFGVRVMGKSMINRRIDDGDTVWINPDKPCRIGRPVLARVWDLEERETGMAIKVLKNSQEGTLWGDGDNEEGRNPVLCSRFQLIGPVVWVSPKGYPAD